MSTSTGWLSMRSRCLLQFSCFALLFALPVLLACTEPTDPLPAGALTLVPPAPYARWYAVAESCSGRNGDFSRVQWFWYDQERVPDYGPDVAALTWQDHRIAIARPFLLDSAVVIHEALHDVLHVHGHPEGYFGTPPTYADGKCGAVVAHYAITH